MNVEQCRATVFLHEPLRLTAWLGGDEVASMQRCTLDSGHRGQHVGLPDPDGKGSLRWDECGVHLGSADRHRSSAPRLHASAPTMSAAPLRNATSPRPTGGRHAAGAQTPEAPLPHSTTQALGALTAAVERLTESIAASREQRV